MSEGVTLYFDWEVEFMKWLQELLGRFGAGLGSIVSCFGEGIVIILIWGIIYWGIDKNFGRFLGFGVCVGIVLNPMIKNVVLRRRPYFDNPDIQCCKPVDSTADIYDISAQGYSFPSGHSTNSAIMYGGIAVHLRKRLYTVLGIIIPLLVALSRMIVGVHYPTDVIIGLLFGALVLFLIRFLYNKIKRRWILYSVIFLLSCTGIIYCRSNDYFTALGFMGGFFLGDLFEERYVSFESAKSIWAIALRTLGGFGVFIIVDVLLKLLLSNVIAESAIMLSYMARTMRYFIVTFVVVGIYPMSFS